MPLHTQVYVCLSEGRKRIQTQTVAALHKQLKVHMAGDKGHA